MTTPERDNGNETHNDTSPHGEGTHKDAIGTDERRRKAWELCRLEGFSYREVGIMLNVSHNTISRDIHAMESEHREEWKDKAETIQDQHIALYRRQISEAWSQWKKSCDRVEEIEKERIDENGCKTTETSKREMLGAAIYLDKMRQAMQAIEKLIPGMYAPLEIVGAHGLPIFTEADRQVMTNAELLLSAYDRKSNKS